MNDALKTTEDKMEPTTEAGAATIAGHQGISALTELIDALEVIGEAAKKVTADGKVSLADLPVILDLFKNFGVLTQAVKDASQIPAEVKDLDGAEATALLQKVLDAAGKIKAA